MKQRDLPPLSALVAFERAAVQLSFARAAKDLGLSPSAISHQIRNLEERLGVRLFARVGRNISITPEGEFYLQAVATALETIERANRSLARENEGPAEIRISSMPFFTSTVLLPTLEAFRSKQPQTTLRIEATHQYADFNTSGVDVAIRYGRERASGLKLEELVEVRSLPVCSPDFVAKGLTGLSDLRDQVLIHLSAQPRAWNRWFSDVGLARGRRQDELWFDTVPAALEAAEQGLGVMLAIHPLIHARPGFGTRLVAPFPNAIGLSSETIYMASRPEKVADRRIVAVRKWIESATKEIVAGADR